MVLVPGPTLRRQDEARALTRDEAMKLYRSQFDASVIDSIRDAVFKRLSALTCDVKRAILHETVDTPATFADQFNLAAGTPFALSHGFRQLSLTRPSMWSSESSKILYCGASTRPGNGVPLVLVGAELAAKAARTRLLQIDDMEAM